MCNKATQSFGTFGMAFGTFKIYLEDPGTRVDDLKGPLNERTARWLVER